jgi:4-hydroxy-tetrahydrodipicolinate synthase
MGPEELLAEAVLLGGHGGVNGGSNLFPELYVSLYEAAARGDTIEVSRLQARVMAISQTIYEPAYLPGIKCAAAAIGLCREVFAAPYEPADEPRRRAIREFIERMR